MTSVIVNLKQLKTSDSENFEISMMHKFKLGSNTGVNKMKFEDVTANS